MRIYESSAKTAGSFIGKSFSSDEIRWNNAGVDSGIAVKLVEM